MAVKTIRCVRIICDGVLKNTVMDGVIQMGANGYTWWKCHGKGAHEHVDDIYEGLDRLYVEVWCEPSVAERIIDFCQSKQFDAYGMTVGAGLIEVSENDKF